MKTVTFYTNSFNRLPLLKNLLRSFEHCNKNPNIEWIITDYGSTDGSREFLADYIKHSTFPVKTILGDEQEYFAKLSFPKIDRRTKFEAILRKYRNDALSQARGTYIFDVATDHQFIRESDWITEIDNIFEHRRSTIGRDDLSGVIAFGYFYWRLKKTNNAVGVEQDTRNVPYYVAQSKGYVDYSVMKKGTLDDVGPYFELTSIRPNSLEMKLWNEKNDSIRPETEYCNRCETRGLKRVFMKYPLIVSFKNTNLEALKVKASDLQKNEFLVPMWTLDEMKSCYSSLCRPISSEELCINRNIRWINRISKGRLTAFVETVRRFNLPPCR